MGRRANAKRYLLAFVVVIARSSASQFCTTIVWTSDPATCITRNCLPSGETSYSACTAWKMKSPSKSSSRLVTEKAGAVESVAAVMSRFLR